MQALGVALSRSAARRGVEQRDSRRFLPRCTSRVRSHSFIHLTAPLSSSPPPRNRWSTFPEANSNNNIVKCFSNRVVQMVQRRHDTARPRRPSQDHVIPASRAIPANRFCNIHTEYEPPQK